MNDNPWLIAGVIDRTREMAKELGLRIEPGGAVALAAVLAGKVTLGARTLVLLSGGNVNPELFDAVMSG